MKLKPIYEVWCTTKFGTGLQRVKATSKQEAKDKFKKRFKTQKIITIDKCINPTNRERQTAI